MALNNLSFKLLNAIANIKGITQPPKPTASADPGYYDYIIRRERRATEQDLLEVLENIREISKQGRGLLKTDPEGEIGEQAKHVHNAIVVRISHDQPKVIREIMKLDSVQSVGLDEAFTFFQGAET